VLCVSPWLSASVFPWWGICIWLIEHRNKHSQLVACEFFPRICIVWRSSLLGNGPFRVGVGPVTHIVQTRSSVWVRAITGAQPGNRADVVGHYCMIFEWGVFCGFS